ncbi:MAG: hypothetical protein HY266_01490 [Deltaproteobacteria bacterium]|nr:hypothetical protein [Deltaproteobacteria bacterium]
MSEKELLQSLEEDTKRECDAMLENARREAEITEKRAAEEMGKVKEQRLEQTRTSLKLERVKRLAGARAYANEVLLKERQRAAAKALDEVNAGLHELRKEKEYPEIVKRLFKEAMDRWRAFMKEEKALAVVPKQDISLFKDLSSSAAYEIVAYETGDMSPGVIVIGKDERFKIINTLHSRLEMARSELVSMIDKALFGEILKSN